MRIAVLERAGQCFWAQLEPQGARRLSGSPFDPGTRADGPPEPWADAELRAPVRPSKVICVGRNYAEHAREMGADTPKEPLLFLKPPSSVIGPGEAVILPPESERVEHEAELGVIIGRRVRRVPVADAMRAVFGYTCACDVTARDLQRKDGQWSRAKGFDSFCPVGPWIETELDPSDLSIRCVVGGATRQDGRTRDMIFDVATVVSYASQGMTLEPGDLILTGTPAGVGPLAPGDRLSVVIDGIGELAVGVASAR